MLSIAIAMAFALWQTRENPRLAGELTAARTEAQAVQAQQVAKIAEQDGQIGELTEILKLSTEKLQQATAALTNRTAMAAPAAAMAPPPPPLSAEAIERLQAQVMAPEIKVEVNQSGDESATYTFPELVSPDGKLLGKDMRFNRQYGSRLAFRPPSGLPVTFEVAELHAGILTHLGIDPYEAQRKQYEMDEKAARRKEDQRERELARRKAEADAMKERAALAKELRKEAFDRKIKLAELENQRTTALAAMKQADAAMIEAQKPPTTLVNNGGFGFGRGTGMFVVEEEPTIRAPQSPRSEGARAPSAIQAGSSQTMPAPPVFSQPGRQPRLPGQLRTRQN